MAEFIDTHAHLTSEQFANDLDATLARASDAGLTRIITLGTDVASSRAAIALAEKYPLVFAAVGIHPEAVRDAGPEDIDSIRELAAHPKVAAIGEIGLDYYWDNTTAALQQSLFERQLRLAAELNLPVSIHDRDAHEDIIAALRAGRAVNGESLRGVLHSFSGDRAMAGEAMELGLMLSFGGPATFLNARRLAALIPEIPLERMLIETDCPYLSPHPLRGRRNEPANVTLVAQRIAALKGLSVEQVAEQTSANARALFSLG